MTDDPRDPMRELARRLRRKERVKPDLLGDPTAGGSGVVAPVWNLPTGTAGQVLTLEDIGGDLIPQFADSAGGGGGGQYWQYLWDVDGSGGWGFVEETIDGQTYPVTELFTTE